MTEYFWKFQWKIALWECCLNALLLGYCLLDIHGDTLKKDFLNKFSDQHDYRCKNELRFDFDKPSQYFTHFDCSFQTTFILIIIALGSYVNQWCNYILYILNSNVSITCWCWENRVVLSFCANIFLVSLFIYTKCIYPVKYVLVLVWFWFSYTKCCAFGNIFVPQMPLPITPLDNDNTWFFLLIFL